MCIKCLMPVNPSAFNCSQRPVSAIIIKVRKITLLLIIKKKLHEHISESQMFVVHTAFSLHFEKLNLF